MNLSSFYDLIRAEVKRGNNFDTSIVAKTRQALRMIEDAKDWRHMERYSEFTIGADVDNPRVLSQPAGCRAVHFLRVTLESGKFAYLPEVNPKDVTEQETGVPTGYWRDGNEYFWFDNAVEEDTAAAIYYTGYTVLPSSTSVDVPVIDLFEVPLVSLVMILLAPTLRMPDYIKAGYTDTYKESMRLRTIADEDSRNKNSDDYMQYTGERRA